MMTTADPLGCGLSSVVKWLANPHSANQQLPRDPMSENRELGYYGEK
jgi:hypothetical protein